MKQKNYVQITHKQKLKTKWKDPAVNLKTINYCRINTNQDLVDFCILQNLVYTDKTYYVINKSDNTIETDECIKPDMLKLNMVKDMENSGYNITRGFLLKYGLSEYEINWLILNNLQ